MNNGKAVNVGRMALAVAMIALGGLCLFSLKEGFTLSMLVFGIIAVGAGIFNIVRSFNRGKTSGEKAPKSKGNDNFDF